MARKGIPMKEKDKSKKCSITGKNCEQLNTLYSLHHVNKLIVSTLHIENVLRMTVESLKEVMGGKSVTLRLLTDDGQKLAMKAYTGISAAHALKKFINPGEGLAGLAWKMNEPVISKDIRKDKRYKYFSYMKGEKVASLIVIPLTLRNKPVGVISVYNEKPSFFKKKHGEIGTMFAEQAAIAIENARLFDELHNNYVNTIKSVASLIDLKDKYTHGHSEKVQRYALEIAREMRLPLNEREVVSYAAFLHDIGKVGIDISILHKKDRLSKEEWGIIRSHPVNGSDVVKKLGFLSDLVPVIRYHHEWYDGKGGYPGERKGEDIPFGARILAVADAYDAMISERAYRPSRTREEAIKELKRFSGTQFDPHVVGAFLKVLKKEEWL